MCPISYVYIFYNAQNNIERHIPKPDYPQSLKLKFVA